MTHIEPGAVDDLADIIGALEDGGVDVTDVRRVERTVSNIGLTSGRYAARLDIEWSASGDDGPTDTGGDSPDVFFEVESTGIIYTIEDGMWTQMAPETVDELPPVERFVDGGDDA